MFHSGYKVCWLYRDAIPRVGGHQLLNISTFIDPKLFETAHRWIGTLPKRKTPK